jgi:hypothetical protein
MIGHSLPQNFPLQADHAVLFYFDQTLARQIEIKDDGQHERQQQRNKRG